jgi:hypothetical protein
MLMENVDPDDGVIEVGVCRLDDLVVLMFPISNSIKTFQHKLKQCPQIFRTRTGDKYVGVSAKAKMLSQ